MRETITKALTAAAVAFAGALGAQLTDGKATLAELGVAAGAALTAGVATWAVPNKKVAPGPTAK